MWIKIIKSRSKELDTRLRGYDVYGKEETKTTEK